MGKITGIGIRLFVDTWISADTVDALYLGVYGSQGGREFAVNLNDWEEFAPGNDVMGVLGKHCHFTVDMNPKALDGGGVGGDNDPAVNPMDLDSVQFVYVKKMLGTAPSKDDRLRLSWAEVFLCDGSTERMFAKRSRMGFGFEEGGKHWLRESASQSYSPKGPCRVRVTLEELAYSETNVGDGIRYRTIIMRQETIRSHVGFSKGQTIHPDLVVLDQNIGRCGDNFSFPIKSRVEDTGTFYNNGEIVTNVYVNCPSVQFHEHTVLVKTTLGLQKSAKFRFKYKIDAFCE